MSDSPKTLSRRRKASQWHVAVKIWSIIGILLTIAIPALAQNTPAPTGISQWSTQITAGPIAIDMATGAMMMTIPVRNKTGAIPFKFDLIDNIGNQGEVTNPQVFLPYMPSGEMTDFTIPAFTTCGTLGVNLTDSFNGARGGFAVIDGTGAKHSFVFGTIRVGPAACGGGIGPYTEVATDGSGYTAVVTGSNNANAGLTWVVYNNDGIVYPNGQGYGTWTDPDGNTIVGHAGTTPTWTDTLGQTGVTIQSLNLGHGTGSDVYYYTDVNGTKQYDTVSYATYHVKTVFTCTAPQGDIDTTMDLVSSVTLPTGGKYTFTYEQTPGYAGDVTGRPSKVTLPSGGYVSFTYGNGNAGGNSVAGYNCISGVIPYLQVTVNDGNGHNTVTSYLNSAQNVWEYGPGLFTVTETDSLNDVTTHYFDGELEEERIISDVSRGVLSKTITCYNGVFTNCPTATVAWNEPNGVTDILQKDVYTYIGALAPSLVETKYDSYGNVTQASRYDFGATMPPSGSPTSTTTTTYDLNGACGTLTNVYIYDRPCSVTTTDSTGATASKTLYTYNSTGHVTETQRLVGGSTYLTSLASYNSNGTVASTADTKNNTTNYYYNGTGGCNNLLLTSTVNALDQTSSQEWNCNGGVVTSTTDANTQTTTSGYNDPLWRQKTVGYPDGGSILINYNTGNSFPWTITTTKAINSTTNLTNEMIYDGLARTTQTQTSDPDGTDYVDTTYDALGRKYTVSNPHRSGSSLSDGTTTYYYDALDRTTDVTEPDNSTVTTNYTNNCSTVTDESSNARESCVDGLGRVTGVWEDPGSSPHMNYETDYQYNALDELNHVDQWGGAHGSSGDRVRAFTYDDLGRLTSTSNPESGTTQYFYTLSGSLCSGDVQDVCQKTDARNISTTYSYDALNRKRTVTASGIAYTYTYDIASTPGGFTSQYPVGRLVEESNAVNASTQYGYDKMGRVAYEANCTPSNCTQTGNMVSAVYDLAGDVTSLTYPDGRTIMSAPYNSAQHLTNLYFANWNGTSVNSNYITSATYAPDGSPAAITYGSGSIESDQWNDRLQPYESAVQTDAGGLDETVYDKHYCYGPSDSRGCTTLGNDNGNVFQVLDTLSNNRSQGFSYDTLNRVIAFSNGNSTMSQSFGYDPWGNMTQAGTQAFQTGYTTANQINLSGFVYDAAGDLTQTDIGIAETYGYDSLGQITNYHNGGATYTYDAVGQRVRKDSGGSWTEYIYWNGQPLAEKNADGSWSDYIYGNGKRIARADSYDQRIHISGTSTVAGSYAAWYLGFADYVVKSGDRISFRQYQTVKGGGIGIGFTDGTSTNWTAKDTDGEEMNNDGTVNSWHYRTVDLTAYAGKTANHLWVASSTATPAGAWSILYGEIAIYSADGTMTTVYERQPGESFSYWTGGGETNTAAVVERSNTDADAETAGTTTTYYVGDQIGSARMQIAAGGWPVSMDDYYPFGVEQATPADANHYKFTGKERDVETGNDYFGARYYNSIMGRFMSPDPLLESGRPDNPQTWNRYSYVLGNPLSNTDPTGMYEKGKCTNTNSSNCGNMDTTLGGIYNQLLAAILTASQNFDDEAKFRLMQAVNNLGAPGETNSSGQTVTINFDGNQDGPGYTTGGGTKNVRITLNPAILAMPGDAVPILAHEAVHVGQATGPDFVGPGSVPAISYSAFVDREYPAFITESFAAQYEPNHVSSFFVPADVNRNPGKIFLWNKSWTAIDTRINRQMGALRAAHEDADGDCKANGGCK